MSRQVCKRACEHARCRAALAIVARSIFTLMNGKEWGADTLDKIAGVFEAIEWRLAPPKEG